MLLELLDLCLENTAASGTAPSMVTTRQLADKVIELYWRQVAPFGDAGGVLRQTRGRREQRAAILSQVHELRDQADDASRRTPTVARARVEIPDVYEACVREVEWTLIRYPLVLLQRVGGQDVRFLYEIGWDEGVRRAEVRSYQRGNGHFDNRILLRPGVGEYLVQLNNLLRPVIHQQWANDVARINQLDESRLHAHLFGVERQALTSLTGPLLEMQGGRCFYCEREVRSGAEVDHFLPWSRHPEDAIENLVVADRKCNNDKRDFLAAAEHVERWHERMVVGSALHEQLVEIAAAQQWEQGADRTVSVARAIYARLSEDVLLWSERGRFVRASRERLQTALGIEA